MKTQIRRLDSLTHNDTAATKLINDNFSALQQGIEDSLSRTGKTPNFMDAPLDMNMNRIINIADPVDPHDLANKKYVDESVATFQQQLNAEALARQLADTALQGNIDAEETRAKAAEKAITDTLDTYGNIVTHDVDEFATASQGAKADTAVQPDDLGDATLTIKKNGTSVGTFTSNSKTDTDINLIIPTTAADVSALPDSTKYAASASLSINSSTYVVTLQLKDQDGNNIGSAQTVDLPLESVVVSGEYDSQTQSIILTLDNGNTITIPVGGLISGLQEEITSSNKLDADLVDDSTSTNKFVTASDKTAWSGKQDALTAGTGINIASNVISTTGEDVIVFDEFSFMETPSSPNVSEVLFNAIILSDSRVVDGRQYFPMFISDGTNNQYLTNYITYRKSNKKLTICTNHTVGHNRGFSGTLVLIPCNSDATGLSQVGYCNGFYDITSSKTIVTDNQISGMLTTSDIATSVDSSSTNDKTVGAKLFYDTVGDVETLLQGLR